MAKSKRYLALALLLALAPAAACGGGGELEDDGSKKGKKEEKDKKKKEEGGGHGAVLKPKAPVVPALPPLPPRTFRDTDFVESESNRDPFRSFLADTKGKPVVTQRKVLMPNTPIGNVRLIAIVTGLAQPRAMIVDEKGVGYVATRGDFVGQAEVVQSGSENLVVSLNWRVDRIRENEVVLAREDPTGPNRPPLTRVIALHEPEDKESALAMPSEG